MLKISAWLLHPQLVTRLHLPHAIVVGLRVPKTDVVFLKPVGLSIQDEVMDVARSAPHRAHYCHADVIYLLP